MKYRLGKDAAPRITAKGWGVIAEQLLALAAEHDVPLWHDRDLAAALAVLDLETEIPAALYQAVAEVLAFVYRINKNAAQGT